MTFPLRPPRLLLALAAAALLSGCASFRGSQERLTAADMQTFRPVCPTKEDLDVSPPGSSRAAGIHRDRVIMTCIKAIEGKYSAFVVSLDREAAGTGLGTDLLSQTFSTVASVVDKASVAKKLAAGATLSLGVGASVNKDLFYKQTLPAIVASLDARRNKILTAIAQGGEAS